MGCISRSLPFKIALTTTQVNLGCCKGGGLEAPNFQQGLGCTQKGSPCSRRFLKISLRNYCIKCLRIEEIWPFHGYPSCGYPFWSRSKFARPLDCSQSKSPLQQPKSTWVVVGGGLWAPNCSSSRLLPFKPPLQQPKSTWVVAREGCSGTHICSSSSVDWVVVRALLNGSNPEDEQILGPKAPPYNNPSRLGLL